MLSLSLQWLVADPRRNQFSFDPFKVKTHERSANPTLYPGRLAHDPFWSLPDELLVEIFTYLTCMETFRWRVASARVNAIAIPQHEYRRYTKEEMSFMPMFLRDVEQREASKLCRLTNWKHVFELTSRTWRSDDGLRNRRRIWKILQPMAEGLVETSKQNIAWIMRWTGREPPEICLTRGSVGRASGAQGRRETLLLVEASTSGVSTGSGHGDQGPGLLYRRLEEVKIWLDDDEGYTRGLQFVLAGSNSSAAVSRHLGTRTATVRRILVDEPTWVLTGFNLCWYDGCVRGLQCIFADGTVEPTEYSGAEFLSARYGRWDGPARRLVAPRIYRVLAGLTGFVTSSGRIETLAILEQKTRWQSVDGRRRLIPPDTVPLTQQECSIWHRQPPSDVELLARQGPVVDDWRFRSADCEVFEPTPSRDAPGQLRDISLFTSGEYLSGIKFRYGTRHGKLIVSHLGNCKGEKAGTVKLGGRDEITAVLVSVGAGGIHSLQVCVGARASQGTLMSVCSWSRRVSWGRLAGNASWGARSSSLKIH